MKLNRSQRGVALLVAMVVIVGIVAALFFSQFGAVSNRLSRDQITSAALVEAKEALIAYAVQYIDTPSNNGQIGFLPCPDYTTSLMDEGREESACGSGQYGTVLGRFPWKTLGLSPLKDGSNECLWYAVSGSYKNNTVNTKPEMVNDDTNGLLILYDAQGQLLQGINPEDRVVAVLISSGPPLPGQNRPLPIPGAKGTEICGGDYNAANYLEGNGVIDNSILSGVEDTVDSFIQANNMSDNASPPFNDRIITITQGEIWRAVRRRNQFQNTLQNLTQDISECVAEYGNLTSDKNLPWPAELNLGAPGTDYRLRASYQDAISPGNLLGRLPADISNSEDQLDNNPGGGPTQACTDCLTACQTTYDNTLQALQDTFDQALIDAQTAFDNCTLRPPRRCQTQYDNAVRQADNDLRRDQNQAGNVLSQCTRTCNQSAVCAGGGGGSTRKNRNKVLEECVVHDFSIGSTNDILWQNWKDHLFYVVSGGYAPDSTIVSCDGTNCVRINGSATEYAAIVMFSGQRIGTNRNAPPPVGDNDDKQTISNYLEGANATADVDGNNTFESNAVPAGNDYMMCISELMAANECP